MSPPPSRRSRMLALRKAQSVADHQSPKHHISQANRVPLGSRKKATRRTHHPEPVPNDNSTVPEPIIKFEPIDPPQQPTVSQPEDHHDAIQGSGGIEPQPNIAVQHQEQQRVEAPVNSVYNQGPKHANPRRDSATTALRSDTRPSTGLSRADARPSVHRMHTGPFPRSRSRVEQIKRHVLSNSASPSVLHGHTGVPGVFRIPDRVMNGSPRSPARPSLRPRSRAPLCLKVPPTLRSTPLPPPPANQRRFEPNFTHVFQNTQMWMDVYQNCGYSFQVEAFVDWASQIPTVIKCGTFATLDQANRVVLQVFSEDSESLMAERYEKMVFRETNEVPSSGHWIGYCFGVYHPVLRLWVK
ncbi:hypothetical protein TruAng_012310 [Truncatella angustata]|nr:hypothetical protein TruAng_012310 [Truncatella angustata]